MLFGLRAPQFGQTVVSSALQGLQEKSQSKSPNPLHRVADSKVGRETPISTPMERLVSATRKLTRAENQIAGGS